jgi:hypothetical protein
MVTPAVMRAIIVSPLMRFGFIRTHSALSGSSKGAAGYQ